MAPAEFRAGGAIAMGVLSIFLPLVGVVLAIIAIVKGSKGLGQAPAGHPARGGLVLAIVLGSIGLLVQFTFWFSVVLAGVVFVLVQDLGEANQEPAPSISFLKDDTDDRLAVARVDPGVDWSAFQIRAEGGPVYVQLNDESSPSSLRLGAGFTQLPAATVADADFLDFCADSEVADVEITLLHTSSNSQVYHTNFRTVQAC